MPLRFLLVSYSCSAAQLLHTKIPSATPCAHAPSPTVTARETRTVITSTQLSIYTSDCGTLEYNARVSGEELQSLETKINDRRGQQLEFGFGKFQFWSGPKMVYTVGGIE